MIVHYYVRNGAENQTGEDGTIPWPSKFLRRLYMLCLLVGDISFHVASSWRLLVSASRPAAVSAIDISLFFKL